MKTSAPVDTGERPEELGVSGLEVLKRVRSDARTREVVIVMLTSSAEERDIIESYRLGVNSYIVKPVDFTQFTESIKAVGMYWLLLNKPPVGRSEEAKP